MRVLVVESNRHSADGAVRDLETAGHSVVRCHEAGATAFPCNALRDHGTCPLEHAESVDVILDYRAHALPRPTVFEDGVSCALRQHVPLVVAGTAALNPFDKWTTEIAGNDDIVEACERAVIAPIEQLASPTRAEARRRLQAQPDVAEKVDVSVLRTGGQLDATIHLPIEAAEADGTLAVAVAGVIRAHDRFASRVNVSVERVASGPSASRH